MKLKFVFLIIISAFISLHAQKKFLKDCNEVERVRLIRGDTFFNNCDSAYVLNDAAVKELLGKIMKSEAIIDTMEKQREILKEIINNQNKVFGRYDSIYAIQESSYKYLKLLQDSTSNLVRQSVQNTDKALKYANKVQALSYVTAGIIGGVAGGLIDSKTYNFGLGGALVGVLSGVLINALIQTLF